jgi:hypothetical protein
LTAYRGFALAVAIVVLAAVVAATIVVLIDDSSNADEDDEGSPPGDPAVRALFMFCEPLQQGGQAADGAEFNPIATVFTDDAVVYRDGGCEPDIDAAGLVAVRSADGAITRVAPTYVDQPTSTESIIWTPAKGELNGVPTVMTGEFIVPDAEVIQDSFSNSVLLLNMTNDGQDIFSSLTRRVQGLPMAAFVNGEQLIGRDGLPIAATVLGEISDALQITGLTRSEAERISKLLNDGILSEP